MAIPKKHLGQHFLKDLNIAEKIGSTLQGYGTNFNKVLEIGPGQGVLTQYLYPKYNTDLFLSEIDKDLIEGLQKKFPLIKDQILVGDFLELDISAHIKEPFAIIGNFPYNISSQIIFKLINYRAHIPEFAGMFQKEVAERIIAPHGNKEYGLLSVWLQTFYEGKVLFSVHENAFFPPPKVKSAVIWLTRKSDFELLCSEKLYFQIIKAAFNQRRKTLRNTLSLWKQHYDNLPDAQILQKRPEELPFSDFITIAKAFDTK